ncbi:NAD(P)(+) transhydrogenase (Re/Si-specific) subunit beta [Candidatus Pelagisphaera phototrophica]|uniref:NAD(P)(+) transhydrogenase (Re/Si-specific) subunit beta n=1 Tax=Candidatus Pelagisphaera phototrophica TaxID=2684113 RepID=UPI0019ECBD34|nr:NAD(P)(+) transhydrogenase (Re/Si-specific) subunit beta [Candidatus Pelagisphaera phototrophica]QXD32590.1 NAD(P)(+) transhydrogenase (Re/Si-specific) subunit beta [Candidatus Pelagisphaera phototrophica]
MSFDSIINLAYVIAATLFVFGIKMLGSAETARRGNMISGIGMLIAIVVTLLNKGMSYEWIVAGLIVGTLIGGISARVVKMTSMPELVALFNGFGGLASLLVAWAELEKVRGIGWQAYSIEMGTSSYFSSFVIYLAMLIGGITFTGSLYAYGKLSGRLSGQAKVFPGQKGINALMLIAILVVGVLFAWNGDLDTANKLFLSGVVLALIFGVMGVMPIGGGDMPVVISLLNSCSGLAASAAGFVIANNVLIVAGCLVGASGLILTAIMCKAMNRSLGHVLFSGFGATSQSEGDGDDREPKSISVQDAYYVLEAASSVVFIPGYGMAVAQAQHVVKELGELLEKNGAEVNFAIHPVAGRMPGHMNVLLAEADVSYDQLVEMDNINPVMPTVDVAVVIGANDVVNPAASQDESSPIYGMPIIEAHNAKTVFILKRGQGKGFSGLVNKLFVMDNSRMIYGDAKATISELVNELKG